MSDPTNYGSSGGSLQAGNLFFTSGDGSVRMSGGPALGQIDLRAASREIVISPELDWSPGGVQTYTPGTEWPTFGPGTQLFMRILQAWIQATSLLGNFLAVNPTLQIGTNGSVNNILGTSTISSTTLTNGATTGPKNQLITVATNPASVFAPPPLDGTLPSIFLQTQTTAGTTFKGKLHILYALGTLL